MIVNLDEQGLQGKSELKQYSRYLKQCRKLKLTNDIKKWHENIIYKHKGSNIPRKTIDDQWMMAMLRQNLETVWQLHEYVSIIGQE